MTVDSKTLALSIATRGHTIHDGAALFARLDSDRMVNRSDIVDSLDMIMQRLNDEWRIFIRAYEDETKRIREDYEKQLLAKAFRG
jgi:hypothetical protein